MTKSGREQREADLVTYYNNEVADRADRDLPLERIDHRATFLDRLHAERRRSVLEVGTGPGRDGDTFVDAGFTYTGVDLSPASVDVCRSRGPNVHVASVLDLPFADGTFDAGWTMSTLLHIADDDLDTALAELVRVLTPGAPLAIGLWGKTIESEETHADGGRYGAARFFSFRSDADLRTRLERFGSIDEWETWDKNGVGHYQWIVLRTAS